MRDPRAGPNLRALRLQDYRARHRKRRIILLLRSLRQQSGCDRRPRPGLTAGMPKSGQKKKLRPAQKQRRQPGRETDMTPRPKAERTEYKGADKLRDKVALITGGDSGIGRAVAILFAKEGADVAISYLNEHKDAEETRRQVEQEGRRCLTLPGDIGEEDICREMVGETVNELGRLDILVNNAAEQHPQEDIQKVTRQQLERTFQTNIFSYFYFVKAALKHLKRGST